MRARETLQKHWDYIKFRDMTERQEWAIYKLLADFHAQGRTLESSAKKSHDMREKLGDWGYLPSEKNRIIGQINVITDTANALGPDAQAAHIREVEDIIQDISRFRGYFMITPMPEPRTPH